MLSSLLDKQYDPFTLSGLFLSTGAAAPHKSKRRISYEFISGT